MTPAARAAAAIEILDAWEAGAGRAERLIRDWGRANRYAGSKDRRAVQDIVYDCLRRRRSYAWGHGAVGGRGMILGRLRAAGEAPESVFGAGRYAPAPLSEAEIAETNDPPPDPVRYDHPDWLEGSLKQSLGQAYAATMEALQSRAPIGLRVNRLKSDVASAQQTLAVDGIEAERSDLDEDALVAPSGARIAGAAAYLHGHVELQDPASQAAARLAGAVPGETVLDYCAGGGGKALAFAAQMSGRGRLILHDKSSDRVAQAQARMDRAGAPAEYRDFGDLGDLEGACDLVFVDAPCSGSGSWRRDPEGKWRLSEAGLKSYLAAQREVFREAVRYVAPGGRIAYATCSILREENADQCAAFSEGFANLSPISAIDLKPSAQSDGFFCQIFRRR